MNVKRVLLVAAIAAVSAGTAEILRQSLISHSRNDDRRQYYADGDQDNIKEPHGQFQ